MGAEPLLLAVDGHSIVFRAWFAMSDRLTTKDGTPTRGALGFTRMFLKAIKDYQPDYAAVTFDTAAPTFRKDKYPQYKAHRPPIDPELHAQIPIVKEILSAYAVPVYEKDKYEADDVIGALCRRATAAGVRTRILTGDSDQLQLVNARVSLAMYTGFGNVKVYDEDAVRAKYDGLGPEFVAQIKALAGDKSDNIPGVPKIGEKTAFRLLNHFGGLKALFGGLDEVAEIEGLRGAKRVQELLREHEEQAWLSYDLAQIDADAPIEFDLEAARLGAHDPAEWRAALQKYEFNSLIKQLDDAYGAAAQAALARPTELEVEIARDKSALDRLIAELTAVKRFAFDVETDALDPLNARIVGLSFAHQADRGWYVPVGHDAGEQLERAAVLDALRPLFEDAGLEKTAHNGNFDMTVLAANGVRVRGLRFDTLIAAALCGVKQIGLKQLSAAIFNEEMTPISELIGSGRNQLTMNQVEIERAAAYAVADAVVTWRLERHFETQIQAHNQRKVFYEIETPFLPVVVDMQLAGFAVDAAALAEMSGELAREIETVEQAIGAILPEHPFNINSPSQLSEALFVKLKAPTSRRTKTTGWSVDENALETLRARPGLDDRVYELVDGILKYRELAKLKSTYVDALPNLINKRTRRVHTTFNQVGSDTGRLSSVNPNIQNIPVRTELGRRIRSAFHADRTRGLLLLSADYSQIELRILAHISQEPSLLKAFQNGEDVHAATAQAMYDVEKVSPEQRRVAKILNFGVIYGLGPYGIARQTDLSQKQGKEFIELYFGKYPGIRAAITLAKERARQNGYAETLFGRRRYLPALRDAKGAAVAAAERIAVNMPIQGTAADIVKIAMVNIARELRRSGLQSRMIAQIHDEIIFEFAPAERAELERLVADQMRGAALLAAPLEVKMRVGPNWGALD